jgi:hypothetical protein
MAAEIIPFARPAPADATPKRKRRREPLAWIMVPARILLASKRLQDSLDVCIDHEGKSVGKTIDWRSVYEILALLDTATRLPGAGGETV